MDANPYGDTFNQSLLDQIPPNSRKLIDIGCNTGALAREFKKSNPDAHFVGLDINPRSAEAARSHCDSVLIGDIELMEKSFYEEMSDRDCWIFGDSLEHLKDPWKVLSSIREHIPLKATIVSCIPNVQHWSVMARLSAGDFRYQDIGLLDRTHLRWFTRQTAIDLFELAGFSVEHCAALVYDHPGYEKFLPFIGGLAKATGADPVTSMNDALAFQHIIRAVPA